MRLFQGARWRPVRFACGRRARDQIIALLDRDPAARVSLDDPRAAAWLLEGLLKVGAGKQATVLADRAAAHAPLGHPHVVILLGVL